MDIKRLSGVIAALVACVLIVLAWQSASTPIGPMEPTIVGYGRNTVLLACAGLVAVVAAAAAAAFIMPRPTP